MALPGQSSTFTPPGSQIPGQFAADARLRKQRAADRERGIYPVPHGRIEPPRVYQDEVGKARQLKYGNDQALRGGDEGPGGFIPHPTPSYGHPPVAPPMPMGETPASRGPNGASGPISPSGQVNPFQPAAQPMPSALSRIGGTPSVPAPVPSNGYDEPGVTLPNAMPAQARFSVPPAPVTPINPGPVSALAPTKPPRMYRGSTQPDWQPEDGMVDPGVWDNELGGFKPVAAPVSQVGVMRPAGIPRTPAASTGAYGTPAQPKMPAYDSELAGIRGMASPAAQADMVGRYVENLRGETERPSQGRVTQGLQAVDDVLNRTADGPEKEKLKYWRSQLSDIHGLLGEREPPQNPVSNPASRAVYSSGRQPIPVGAGGVFGAPAAPAQPQLPVGQSLAHTESGTGPASALTPNNTKPLTVQPNWSFPPGRVPQQPDSEPLQPTNAHPGLSPLQRFNLPKPLIPTLQTGDDVQQSMQAPSPLDSPPIPYDPNQPRLAIPTPPRKLLPPPTPQDVAAISRSQAEGRGADRLRDKIARIMMSPPLASEREDMFRRNNYGTSIDPVQRAKDFRLNESMANQHEHNVAGQKIIDRNQGVHESRSLGPTNAGGFDTFGAEYNNAMNGRPAGFGSQASRNAMTPEQRRYVDAPQAGVQSQPQSIFQRQAPPNNRMQGSVPSAPPRDMSGANGVAISPVDGSKGPQVGYIPANRSDGTVGTSRFVEGQKTPLGTRVVRNPKTGGLALIGKGISGPSSGAADDPFAGNVPTQPTAAQFQAMQQQGSANETARIKARDTEEREADRLAGGQGRSKRQIADEVARDERVLSATRKNRLGMDIPAVARAAGREKIRAQDDLNKAAGMVANKSTIPGSLESKIKGGRNARGSDIGKWMESKAVDNDGYPFYSNEQDNLHSALEKEWGTMTTGEKRQAKDWYEQNEKYNKPQTWMGGGSWQGTPGDKKLKLLFKELDKGAAKPPASPPSQGATIPPTYGGTPPISPVKRGSSKL